MLTAAIGLFAQLSFAGSPPPLHERIDAVIESRLSGSLAPPAADEEFVRRLYVDLHGAIPALPEVRAFLDDTAANKRELLIDRLLASPAYARRMSQLFDIVLMQRRVDKHVPSAEWQEYLRAAFAENKPYDQLVREILSASGEDGWSRPAAKFYLDRDGEANLLTRDVGRLFFGRDMQCAQCHDHPLIDGYKQDHYYGLFAFLSRSFVFTDAKLKKSFLAEKAEGDVTFKSVFDPNKTTHSTGPHLIDGSVIAEPKFAKGEEYFVAPAKDVRPIPKFSRRAQLASVATNGQSADFNRNIVNRLWAVMMGRGLVNPVDLHHADNPPSHPELLELLASEFVAMKYDTKDFLRQLALTRTYQRSSEIPEGMSEEQAAPEKYAVASLKPLSAEQLAFSLLEASGITGTHRDAERARYSADRRLEELLQVDAKRQYLREEMVERAVFEKLKPNLPQFVTLYGGSPGEPEHDFHATVHQALYLANGATVKSWLTSGANGLVNRLAANRDLADACDELYLSVLSRRPTEEERQDALEYIVRRGDKPQAGWEDLAWALLASTEFRFNH